MSRLVTTPLTIGEAKVFVQKHHEHHYPPESALFAVGVSACPHPERCPRSAEGVLQCPPRGLSLRCVAMIGRPVARVLDQRGNVAELTRCASDRTPHAASKTIAAASRMALAGGYTRLVSYTILGETGASYVAAGWWITGLVHRPDGWDSRPGRDDFGQRGCKVRWEFGPEALPADGAAALVVGFAAGVVDVPDRSEKLPLLRLMPG